MLADQRGDLMTDDLVQSRRRRQDTEAIFVSPRTYVGCTAAASVCRPAFMFSLQSSLNDATSGSHIGGPSSQAASDYDSYSDVMKRALNFDIKKWERRFFQYFVRHASEGQKTLQR